MEINRLNRGELVYELRIRGVVHSGTVDNMRCILRDLTKVEKAGQLIKPEHPYAFAEDIVAVRDKITEVEGLIGSFVDDRDSSEYKKIQAKTKHLLGRVQNVKAQSEEEVQQRSDCLVATFKLMDDIDAKLTDGGISTLDASLVEDEPENLAASTIINNQPQIQLHGDPRASSVSNNPPQIRLHDDPRSSHLPASTPSPPIQDNGKPLQIVKWNLKFSGEPKEMSLSAFLQRVSELSFARKVSEDELYRSALDLFTGKALMYYRANRHRVTNWNSLVALLRAQFQPRDYDDKLKEEIKHRTQAPGESIGLYIAAMESLYSRLTDLVPEAEQVKTIRKNLLPYYQTSLGLQVIDSIETLLSLCRGLEETKSNIENYIPPRSARNVQFLEPDLAYVDAGIVEPNSANVDQEYVATMRPNGRVMKCFNCQGIGHRFSECSKPRNKFCYKCGQVNVTVRTCSKCNRTGISGN